MSSTPAGASGVDDSVKDTSAASTEKGENAVEPGLEGVNPTATSAKGPPPKIPPNDGKPTATPRRATSTNVGAPKEKKLLLTTGGGAIGMDLEQFNDSGYEFMRVSGFYKSDDNKVLPAEASRVISIGDIILQINGKKVFKKSYDDAIQVLIGAARNSVSIQFVLASQADALRIVNKVTVGKVENVKQTISGKELLGKGLSIEEMMKIIEGKTAVENSKAKKKNKKSKKKGNFFERVVGRVSKAVQRVAQPRKASKQKKVPDMSDQKSPNMPPGNTNTPSTQALSTGTSLASKQAADMSPSSMDRPRGRKPSTNNGPDIRESKSAASKTTEVGDARPQLSLSSVSATKGGAPAATKGSRDVPRGTGTDASTWALNIVDDSDNDYIFLPGRAPIKRSQAGGGPLLSRSSSGGAGTSQSSSEPSLLPARREVNRSGNNRGEPLLATPPGVDVKVPPSRPTRKPSSALQPNRQLGAPASSKAIRFQPQKCTVAVPPGKKAGDTFVISLRNAQGRRHRLTVPAGKKPGDKFAAVCDENNLVTDSAKDATSSPPRPARPFRGSVDPKPHRPTRRAQSRTNRYPGLPTRSDVKEPPTLPNRSSAGAPALPTPQAQRADPTGSKPPNLPARERRYPGLPTKPPQDTNKSAQDSPTLPSARSSSERALINATPTEDPVLPPKPKLPDRQSRYPGLPTRARPAKPPRPSRVDPSERQPEATSRAAVPSRTTSNRFPPQTAVSDPQKLPDNTADDASSQRLSRTTTTKASLSSSLPRRKRDPPPPPPTNIGASNDTTNMFGVRLSTGSSNNRQPPQEWGPWRPVEGCQCQVYSKSAKGWVDAIVEEVHPVTSKVTVSYHNQGAKYNKVISPEVLQQMLRPGGDAVDSESPSQSSGQNNQSDGQWMPKQGDRCEVLSQLAGGWTDATVASVDPATGAVSVSLRHNDMQYSQTVTRAQMATTLRVMPNAADEHSGADQHSLASTSSIDATTGAVTVSYTKNGSKFTKEVYPEERSELLRESTSNSEPPWSPSAGDMCQVYSDSSGGWIDGTVESVDAMTGAVTVSYSKNGLKFTKDVYPEQRSELLRESQSKHELTWSPFAGARCQVYSESSGRWVEGVVDSIDVATGTVAVSYDNNGSTFTKVVHPSQRNILLRESSTSDNDSKLSINVESKNVPGVQTSQYATVQHEEAWLPRAGGRCQVYSESAGRWINGLVESVDAVTGTTSVSYYKNGAKFIKTVSRSDGSALLRESKSDAEEHFGSHDLRSESKSDNSWVLQVGEKCEVFDEGTGEWCPGSVQSIDPIDDSVSIEFFKGGANLTKVVHRNERGQTVRKARPNRWHSSPLSSSTVAETATWQPEPDDRCLLYSRSARAWLDAVIDSIDPRTGAVTVTYESDGGLVRERVPSSDRRALLRQVDPISPQFVKGDATDTKRQSYQDDLKKLERSLAVHFGKEAVASRSSSKSGSIYRNESPAHAAAQMDLQQRAGGKNSAPWRASEFAVAPRSYSVSLQPEFGGLGIRPLAVAPAGIAVGGFIRGGLDGLFKLPAEACGEIQAGDIVVAINSHAIRSLADFRFHMQTAVQAFRDNGVQVRLDLTSTRTKQQKATHGQYLSEEWVWDRSSVAKHMHLIDRCRELEEAIRNHVNANDFERAGAVDRELAGIMAHLLIDRHKDLATLNKS